MHVLLVHARVHLSERHTPVAADVDLLIFKYTIYIRTITNIPDDFQIVYCTMLSALVSSCCPSSVKMYDPVCSARGSVDVNTCVGYSMAD